jgi:hypothetical protein
MFIRCFFGFFLALEYLVAWLWFCQIVMQPLKELPAPAQLWKDKFLIQVFCSGSFQSCWN